VGGLTLAELVRRTRCKRYYLVPVLAQEEKAGHLRRDDSGRYSLCPDAFPPAVLAAIRGLELDGDHSRAARSRRIVALGAARREVSELVDRFAETADVLAENRQRPRLRPRR
jgi:hypothetical protein